MAEKFRIVACPTCAKDVEWRPENKWRPFCSERCKLIDLGEWATEKYKVPDVERDDFDDREGRG
jgi:endogenous inhibitor of DNA gyrase (YacG/DUF329 family)